MDHDSDFAENYSELRRILKGDAIVTLPHPSSFILKDSIPWKEKKGHYQITNDLYGLRNGDIFRVWQNEEEIFQTFSADFEDICIGRSEEEYYGMHIALWYVVMKKNNIGVDIGFIIHPGVFIISVFHSGVEICIYII